MLQLQVNDWSMTRPYPISIRTEEMQRSERPVVTVKYLRPGCGGMNQYMLTTDVQNLFGFAHVNHIGRSLADLASREGRNPPLVALKNDDVLALSSGRVTMSISNCELAWLSGRQTKQKEARNEAKRNHRLRRSFDICHPRISRWSSCLRPSQGPSFQSSNVVLLSGEVCLWTWLIHQ